MVAEETEGGQCVENLLVLAYSWRLRSLLSQWSLSLRCKSVNKTDEKDRFSLPVVIVVVAVVVVLLSKILNVMIRAATRQITRIIARMINTIFNVEAFLVREQFSSSSNRWEERTALALETSVQHRPSHRSLFVALQHFPRTIDHRIDDFQRDEKRVESHFHRVRDRNAGHRHC